MQAPGGLAMERTSLAQKIVGGDARGAFKTAAKTIAMGKKMESVAAESQEHKQERRDRRLKGLAAGGALFDWALGAPAAVQDIMGLSEQFDGLYKLKHSIAEAALMLDKDEWVHFQLLAASTFHHDDYNLHAVVLPRADPSWLHLMQKPHRFLHMGAPPSEPLLMLLGSLGWTGVCLGPEPPPEIFVPEPEPPQEEEEEDSRRSRRKTRNQNERPVDNVERPAETDFVEAHFEDLGILDYADPQMGTKFPGKAQVFPLVYLNHFLPEPKWRDSQSWTFEPEEDVAPLNSPRPGSAPGIERFGEALNWEYSNFDPRAGVCEEGAQRGLLGASISDQPRRNLARLRNALIIAIARVEIDGALLIAWPGAPMHPVFIYFTNQLRSLFMRVTVFPPQHAKSFEVYVLCMGRHDTRPTQEGEIQKGFEYFLNRSQREFGVDDALCWTLPHQILIDEIKGKFGGKSGSTGWDETWRVFGEKYWELAKELGATLGAKMGKMVAPDKRKSVTTEIPDSQQKEVPGLENLTHKRTQASTADEAAAKAAAAKAKKEAAAKAKAAKNKGGDPQNMKLPSSIPIPPPIAKAKAKSRPMRSSQSSPNISQSSFLDPSGKKPRKKREDSPPPVIPRGPPSLGYALPVGADSISQVNYKYGTGPNPQGWKAFTELKSTFFSSRGFHLHDEKPSPMRKRRLMPNNMYATF